jgi:choline dehydrogenase-like flavoprotein
MFIDARELPSDRTLETDICIVGAGPAGITLAREFVGTPVGVCLVESGGFEADAETDALYAGKAVGLQYFLRGTRLRYFGGTSNHWGGWCRPLNAADFPPRPWVPYSGWPIAAADLKPYYERAHVTCRLGPFDYDPDSWTTEAASALAVASTDIDTAIWHYSTVRFGQAYRAELQQSQNVTVLLYANATNVVANDAVRTVERIRIACLNGTRFDIRAKAFVLACGGIENARLLLHSDKQIPAGLGNARGVVGRFFQEHPLLFVNEFVFLDPVVGPGIYSDWSRPSLPVRAWQRGLRMLGLDVSYPPRVRRGFSISEEAQRRDRLLNWSGTLEIEDSKAPSEFAEDIAAVARALETGSVHEGAQTKRVRLFIRAEQAPNPASRVTLDQDRDALGMRKVVLDWRLGDLDRRSIREGARLLARAVGTSGLGRLRLIPSLADDDSVWNGWLGGSHHMGTTRANDSPREGVVDRDCRVHGLENLFIAGSSVFPTSGFANPTLTIVALAHRLADHIKSLVVSRKSL